MTANNEPDMLELVEADIPRVDLVGKAANGRSFILMKSEGETTNLLDADTVAELVKEAQAEGADDMTDSTQDADVVKDDLDVTEPLAGAGDNPLANDPGSPEWETVDAESAQKWVAILGRAKYAVGVLAEREMIEDASGDSDGFTNAWNLEDAQDAIDWAIGILATYAAGEQAEADLEKAQQIAAVVKAITGDDLALVEGIAPIVKSGRTVVPEESVAAMDGALLNLRKALAGLPVPSAVEVEKADGKPVDLTPEALAKQVEFEARQEAEASRTPVAPVAKDAPAVETPEVEKADGETTDGEPSLEAVFDANGNLKGVVDPAAIQPVQGATADTPEPADPAADTAPAPAATVGADAIAPAAPAIAKTEAEEPLGEDLTKADIDALIKSAVAAAVGDLQKEIEDLRSPATPKVSRYGQKPRPEDLRGQDTSNGIAKAEEVTDLRKQLVEGSTVAEREAAEDQLSKMAQAAMSSIFNGRPVPPQPPRGETL